MVTPRFSPGSQNDGFCLAGAQKCQKGVLLGVILDPLLSHSGPIGPFGGSFAPFHPIWPEHPWEGVIWGVQKGVKMTPK